MDDAVFVVDDTGAVALTNAAVERLLGPAEANFVPQDEDGQPLPDAQTPRRLRRVGSGTARVEPASQELRQPGHDDVGHQGEQHHGEHG
jgi:hypothetical protein